MKVYIKGKGQVDLNTNDYICEGGEGKIYSKGNLVYKVYHDANKMIPSAKIQELSVLSAPNIIKPEDVICDSKNKPLGYTMRFVPHTHPLCKLFTKAFRQREGVSDAQILNIVRRMHETVQHIHSKHILVVDLNEMNFLVSQKFDDVYFIDVDSYQTPGFHATALMESVRDRHMVGHNFTNLTDWFSFGIVSFQLFIGIHPYKGKHPKYTGADALDERMKHNISVLNKDVSIPAVCNPFISIPKEYLDWYTRIFEKGERLPPPDAHGVTVVIVQVNKVKGSNFFDIAEVASVDKDIVNYFYSDGREVIVTEDGVYYNGHQSALSGMKNPVFGFTPKMNHPIGAYMQGSEVALYDLTYGVPSPTWGGSKGKAVMTYGNRIYIQNDTHILEVEFIEGQKLLVGTRFVGNCLEKSTQMLDGVVIQNLLGSYYASFFPTAGTCHQLAIKELNGYKILDAKFENGVMMAVGSKAGKYDRFVFKFNDDWEYSVRIIKDITYSGLNFTVLDNGICVCINEDEKVEIFSNSKDRSDVKEVDDPSIDSSMKLFHRGTKVLFSKGNKLFSMKMR